MHETYEDILAELTDGLPQSYHERVREIYPQECFEAMRIQEEYYRAFLRENLERDHIGEWAIVSGQRLFGIYKTDREASETAEHVLGKQGYLLRLIGNAPGFRTYVSAKYVPGRDE